MTICVYHIADDDGRCSAHLVQKHYRETYNEKVKIVGMNYNMNLKKEVTDKFDLSDQTVFFVDYFHTANADHMIELTNACKKLIVIDHHKTSFDLMKELYHCNHKMITNDKVRIYSHRSNYPIAGVILTYNFLKCGYENFSSGGFISEEVIVLDFAEIDVPPYVQLINNYDVWIHQPLTFNFLNLSDKEEFKELYPNHLKEALSVSNTDLFDPNNIYEALAKEDWKTCKLLTDLCTYGHLIERYMAVKYSNEAQLFAFEFHINDIDNKTYRCIAMNARSNSKCLDIYSYEDFDAKVVFHVKDNKVKMSFYSDNKHVDCSRIANRFGGGGHRGAAGCHIHIEQYQDLLATSKELELEYDRENVV